MSSNAPARFARKLKGYTEEAVAEVVGDADLQRDGRRDIAQARTEAAREHGSPASEPAGTEDRLHDR